MRSSIWILSLLLGAGLACVPPSSQQAAAISSDPGQPAAEGDAERSEPPSLEEYCARFRERMRGIQGIEDEELEELLGFFPDPPAENFDSGVLQYLYEDGFEDVVLLEPFVFVTEYGREERYQLAYADRERIFLLEPPLIQGVLPAGNYLAEIGGLFFEVIGPDGEIWRFTQRADAN